MEMKAISQVFHDPDGHGPVRIGEGVDPNLLQQVEEEGFCVLPSVIDRCWRGIDPGSHRSPPRHRPPPAAIRSPGRTSTPTAEISGCQISSPMTKVFAESGDA